MPPKGQINNDSLYDIFLWISIIFLLLVVIIVEASKAIYAFIISPFRRQK